MSHACVPARLLQLLVLLAIALVPAGWMPRAGGDGALVITLCTGEGIVKAPLDAADDPGHQGTEDRITPGTCPFAGAPGAAVLPATAQALPAGWPPRRASPATGPPRTVAVAHPPSRPPGQGPPDHA